MLLGPFYRALANRVMRDSFLQYKAIDLASEDSFIQWVHAPETEDGMKWSQWLTDHPELSEEVATARHMVQTFSTQKPIAVPTDPQILWNRIEHSIEQDSTSGKVIDRDAWVANRSSRTWYNIALVAAACITILLVLRFLTPGTVQLDVPRGVHMAHQLPDNSKVELNAESSLSYSKKGWKGERLVKLNGEAFFQVEKGNRFVVETPIGEVEVLGTSFNVYQRGENFRVKCMTGSVQVFSEHGGINQILKPGEFVNWDPSSGKNNDDFDTSNEETWWNGTYQFEEVPLTEVFEELERQYDVRVEVNPSDIKENWNGFFTGSDLQKALETVCWTNNLTFETQGDIVLVTKKP